MQMTPYEFGPAIFYRDDARVNHVGLALRKYLRSEKSEVNSNQLYIYARNFNPTSVANPTRIDAEELAGLIWYRIYAANGSSTVYTFAWFSENDQATMREANWIQRGLRWILDQYDRRERNNNNQ